jgi:cytochrome oxidase Cu insertion factor (SCO1/SenC/PrrC family)
VFAVSYAKHPEKTGYSIDHSDGTYLIGTNGKTVLLSPYGQRDEWVAEDIKLLLGL